MDEYLVEMSRMLFAFESEEINTLKVIHTMFMSKGSILPAKFKENFLNESYKRIKETYEGFAQMFSMQEESADDCMVSNYTGNLDLSFKRGEEESNDLPTEVHVNNMSYPLRVDAKIELDDLEDGNAVMFDDGEPDVRDIMITMCNQYVPRLAKKAASQLSSSGDSDDEHEILDIVETSNHFFGSNTTNSIKSETIAPINSESIELLNESNRIFLLVDSDEDHDVKESKPVVENYQNIASLDSELDKNEVNKSDEKKDETTTNNNNIETWKCFQTKTVDCKKAANELKCKQCKLGFTSEANHTRHMRTHASEKSFLCQHCLKRFSRLDNFKSHMLIHANEFPFSCSQCFVGISTKSEKDKHEIGCNIFRFKCDQCDAVYQSKKRLKEHIHSEMRKFFRCERCLKCFSLSQNLKGHMITHNNEFPFICSLSPIDFPLETEMDEKMHETSM